MKRSLSKRLSSIQRTLQGAAWNPSWVSGEEGVRLELVFKVGGANLLWDSMKALEKKYNSPELQVTFQPGRIVFKMYTFAAMRPVFPYALEGYIRDIPNVWEKEKDKALRICEVYRKRREVFEEASLVLLSEGFFLEVVHKMKCVEGESFSFELGYTPRQIALLNSLFGLDQHSKIPDIIGEDTTIQFLDGSWKVEATSWQKAFITMGISI